MFSKYWRVCTVSFVIVISLTIHQGVQAQSSPSPEAVAACEDKSPDDVCSLSPAASSTPGYPVVDTGQTACYDDDGPAIACPAENDPFYGQDAQHTGNASSYTDNGDGTVSDNVTGLMWQQSADTDGDGDIDAADKLTYAEAGAYCDNLTLVNHDDWRLPNIKQLYSLIDFSGTDPSGYEGTDTSGLIPFIDTDYFDFAYGDTSAGERLIDAQYASSTLYVSNTGGDGGSTMFGVNLADGRIKGYGLTLFGQDKTFFVLCTRENTNYGVNNFAGNGDGTITDNATGLMWAQDDSGAGLNWEQALVWVEQKNAANYLGYSDWRLPNAKELQSIVDYTRSPDTIGSAAIDPLFNATAITNEAGETDYSFYWSSTTHVNWTPTPGKAAAYIAFGRAMGYMNGAWIDVHGAGAQRSDPKQGDPDDYPTGHGPQGDAIRIYNYVRLVRDADTSTVVPPQEYKVYLPLIATGGSTPTPTADGYNLFTPLGETTTYLIDEAGNTIFTWPSSYRPGNAVYLLENGNLLRTGNTRSTHFDVGGAGGIVEEITPDGTVDWTFEYDTAQGRLHHDIEALPNGNVLMIAWELKTESEAIAAGRNPARLTEGELWPDMIIEVDPETNTIVWEWHVWDHLIQDYDSNQANYGVVSDHPELIDLNYSTGGPPGSADWNHINAIDYNEAFDQILLSVRSFGEIWVIDHGTSTAEAAGQPGDLLYRWGNPQAYDAGDANDQQLFVQHDAQWIPSGYPGAGNILVFNNGAGRPDGDYSSVDEITPPVDSAGNYTGYGPAAPVWTYIAAIPTDFYANRISSAQRLSDGSTLICDGPDGYFFQVTSEGDLIWNYDYGNQPIFRVTRYPSDHPGLPTNQ